MLFSTSIASLGIGGLFPKGFADAFRVIDNLWGGAVLARSRLIKPDFFRDEKLQDLENSDPSLRPMLVFAGLWTQCDKAGYFPWNPRMLHLDILPFIEFDLGASLLLLREAKLVSLIDSTDGKKYGIVFNFVKHQRISGKESQEPPRYKQAALAGKQTRSNREATSCPDTDTDTDTDTTRICGLVTEESFSLDAAVSFVLIETGLAGKNLREVIHQIIARDIEKLTVDPKACADAMIASWRRYEPLELSYKCGAEKFFGGGVWRKTEAEWRMNGKPTRADGWLPPQNVSSDYVSEGTKRKQQIEAAKKAGL